MSPAIEAAIAHVEAFEGWVEFEEGRVAEVVLK